MGWNAFASAALNAGPRTHVFFVAGDGVDRLSSVYSVVAFELSLFFFGCCIARPMLVRRRPAEMVPK